eukprot:g67100.t1
MPQHHHHLGWVGQLVGHVCDVCSQPYAEFYRCIQGCDYDMCGNCVMALRAQEPIQDFGISREIPQQATCIDLGHPKEEPEPVWFKEWCKTALPCQDAAETKTETSSVNNISSSKTALWYKAHAAPGTFLHEATKIKNEYKLLGGSIVKGLPVEELQGLLDACDVKLPMAEAESLLKDMGNKNGKIAFIEACKFILELSGFNLGDTSETEIAILAIMDEFGNKDTQGTGFVSKQDFYKTMITFQEMERHLANGSDIDDDDSEKSKEAPDVTEMDKMLQEAAEGGCNVVQNGRVAYVDFIDFCMLRTSQERQGNSQSHSNIVQACKSELLESFDQLQPWYDMELPETRYSTSGLERLEDL